MWSLILYYILWARLRRSKQFRQDIDFEDYHFATQISSLFPLYRTSILNIGIFYGWSRNGRMINSNAQAS
jgi:hypothetical protein